MKHKSMILLLALCLVCLLPLRADAAEILGGGELRGGLHWSVDSSGTLTISGEGALSTDTVIMDMASPWYAYYDRITAIVIEEGVTSIDAMGQLPKLAAVTLPESLKEIGYKAFQGCGSLTDIRLPENLTAIGKAAFKKCTNLVSIEIPHGVTVISDSVFDQCMSLQSVTIPESVEKIGSAAFNGCSDLRQVYYSGTEAAWSGITIEKYNQPLLDADVHCGTHRHDFTGVVTEASCIAPGYTTYICDCGEQYIGDVVQTGWHRYEFYNEMSGYVTMVCLDCGDSYKYLHSFDRPATDSNKDAQDYEVYTDTTKSYLVQNPDGTFTRVQHGEGPSYPELYVNDRVYIEQYDEALNFLSHAEIPLELPLFGGYYTDGNCHFLVFGDFNPDASDEKEVFRVVKYSLDWKRLGCTSLYGCNTTKAFYAGSLQMAASGNLLYVRTCHRLYPDGAGIQHQSNYMFTVRISDMKLMRTYGFDDPSYYVSHSFNQLIAVDGSDVILADHGDAAPRTMRLAKGEETVDVLSFVDSGDYHYNYTGASLGGLGVSDSAYLIAGNSIRQDGSLPVDGQRNIFLTVTGKSDFSRAGTTLRWLTHHGDNANVAVSTPHFVQVSRNKFCVLWTEDGVLHYTFVNGEGEQITEVFVSLQGMLSDCLPICANGKIIWYVSDSFTSFQACNYSFVKFFSIDPEEPEMVTVKDVRYETQHQWSEWATVKEPGSAANGVKERICGKCKQVEQAEIPRLKSTPGDLNDDGRVNSLDLILLRQYLANWDVKADLSAADTNGDGRVNGLDLILLRQYLANWDVTLGPKKT